MARGALHLTFDDGPHPEWTRGVLDLLGRCAASATFFVLGAAVREHPEVAAEILEAGHEIGLHGDAHLDHRKAQPDDVRRDTQRSLDTLRELGVSPTSWRLPWGRRGPVTDALAAEHGLRIVGWDADTHDWRGDRWAQQPSAVATAATAGGIVLLHDAIGPGSIRRECSNTLEITASLLYRASAAGTPVVPIDHGSKTHA